MSSSQISRRYSEFPRRTSEDLAGALSTSEELLGLRRSSDAWITSYLTMIHISLSKVSTNGTFEITVRVKVRDRVSLRSSELLRAPPSSSELLRAPLSSSEFLRAPPSSSELLREVLRASSESLHVPPSYWLSWFQSPGLRLGFGFLLGPLSSSELLLAKECEL